MSLFKIGNFDFVSLSRPPSLPKRRLEREVRSGGSGVTFWNVGTWSEPYQLLSFRDCVNVSDALLALADYELVVGQSPLLLTWAGVQKGLVIVHDVIPPDGGCYQTLLGVGGQLGTSRGVCRAVWTLEFVPGNPQQ